MKITAIILISVAVSLSACTDNPSNQVHSREVFNSKGLQVITSFANRKQQTMAILYGNAAARKTAIAAYQNHVPGEVYKLVVSRQANNKYWYGSFINGGITSVEVVSSALTADGKGVLLNYHLESGSAPADSVGNIGNADARIASILAHRPSVFP